MFDYRLSILLCSSVLVACGNGQLSTLQAAEDPTVLDVSQLMNGVSLEKGGTYWDCDYIQASFIMPLTFAIFEDGTGYSDTISTFTWEAEVDAVKLNSDAGEYALSQFVFTDNDDSVTFNELDSDGIEFLYNCIRASF